MRKTVLQQLEKFREENPEVKPEKEFFVIDIDDIMELGNSFRMIETAFYFGYMKGFQARKEGA